MEKSIERLKEYILFKGISLNAFDKSMGFSNGYIGKQIAHNASMGVDKIQKISCIYTDLNIDWLITGRGSMIIGSYAVQDEKRQVNDSPIDYTGPPGCEKCKMKDELITSLHQQIDVQNKLIDCLEEMKSPHEYGQKRKAGS